MAEYKQCCGLNIKKVGIGELLFNKTMIIAYILLAIGLIGWYEIMTLRWAHEFVNNRMIIDAGGAASDHAKMIAQALKEQIFNLHEIEEVNKAEPWGIFVTQYTYLLYGGSALIFLTALAELFHLKIAPKIAAAFMTFGISMVFGGLVSIGTDLANVFNVYWMFLNPQPHSGMWLMLPLYTIYIPFTFIEIYFLITNKRDLARKLALWLVIIGLLIDLGEFYIQGLLFNLNVPRHLWTDIPALWIYFLISGAITGVAGAILFASLALRNKSYFNDMIKNASRMGVLLTVLAALYEVVNYMTVDPKWLHLIMSGSPISWMYWTWIVLGIVVPLLLWLAQKPVTALIGAISALIGTFFMRQAFIYGGNIVPMTDRFSTGPEAISTYEVAALKPYAYIAPHTMEVLIIIGCIGVGIAIYSILDSLFDVRNINDNVEH